MTSVVNVRVASAAKVAAIAALKETWEAFVSACAERGVKLTEHDAAAAAAAKAEEAEPEVPVFDETSDVAKGAEIQGNYKSGNVVVE